MGDIVSVMDDRIEVLYSEAVIAERIKAMAKAIAQSVRDDLLVVSVLKGAFVLSADLVRALHYEKVAPEIDFMMLSSYGDGTESSGRVVITRDVSSEVKGRDVLLIDDILESGRTLGFARQLLIERGARRVETAVILDKKSKRKVTFEADYAGFVCDDLFVVGYGMDKARRFRELPFIGVVCD